VFDLRRAVAGPRRANEHGDVLSDGMTRRRAARFGVVQALYQIEMSGVAPEKVIAEFEDHRLRDLLEPLELEDQVPRVDRAWFAEVTLGAW